MRARAALRRFSGLSSSCAGPGFTSGFGLAGRCVACSPNRSLHDAQTGHSTEPERLVDALYQLRSLVLHFERLRRIDLQVKNRGRRLSGRVGLWGGFCQFCRACIGQRAKGRRSLTTRTRVQPARFRPGSASCLRWAPQNDRPRQDRCMRLLFSASRCACPDRGRSP